MSVERDFEEVQARGEREADDMERRGERLGREIEEARADWEAKKSDERVPGARPADESRQRERADEAGPPPEADITPGD